MRDNPLTLTLFRYRQPTPKLSALPDGPAVGIRPITNYEMNQAILYGESAFSDGLPNDYARDIASKITVVTHCVVKPEPPFERLWSFEEAACLPVGHLTHIYDVWSDVQREHSPDAGRLRSQIILAMQNDASFVNDGMMACGCQSVAEYYGISPLHLVQCQVAYYYMLCSAWMELYGDTGDSSNKVTYVSKDEIKRRANEGLKN